MNRTYSINPGRLLLLIRNTVLVNRNLILVLSAVFSALIILIAIKDTFIGNATNLYTSMYYVLLYIAGFSATWGFAKELHDKRKGTTWLLLPATTMEKFIALLLLTTFVLICGAAVYMAVLSLALEAGIGMVTTNVHKVFNPFNSSFYYGVTVYISIQAPFFAGALYFRKHAISFTILSLFVYWIILVVFASFAGKLLLHEYITPLANISGPMGGTAKLYLMTVIGNLSPFSDIWKPVLSITLRYVFPIVCWIIAFFSLKEMEL